jgi:hypothetical protein
VNLAACGSLPRTPENSFWYRLILTQHLSTALGSTHTKSRVGRFNAGPYLNVADRYASLSFADDPIVAQFEVGAVLGSLDPGGHIPHPRMSSYTTLNVHIILQDVIDLSDVMGAQYPLDTNVQELTGDWRGYQIRKFSTPVQHPIGIAPTQELGRALFATSAEGFRSVSAKIPYHKTLTVFTERLHAGSSLTFTEAHTGKIVHKIP